jgi:hypothetical protein
MEWKVGDNWKGRKNSYEMEMSFQVQNALAFIQFSLLRNENLSELEVWCQVTSTFELAHLEVRFLFIYFNCVFLRNGD